MQLEPQVNRAKYDEGVSTLVAQQAALEARGVFLLSSTRFPYVELLFAPRHPVQIPMFAPPVLNLPQGSVITPEVPSLAARAFKAHFDLTDLTCVLHPLSSEIPGRINWLSMVRCLLHSNLIKSGRINSCYLGNTPIHISHFSACAGFGSITSIHSTLGTIGYSIGTK